jgi:hypothetical protein
MLARRYKYRTESTETIDVGMDGKVADEKIHSEPMA